MGNKLSYKHLFLEPFFGFGLTEAKITKTVYNENPPSTYVRNYPVVTNNYTIDYLQLNIGIKLGYSFKRSKKHDAIDKKFDDVYIPKAEVLENYFKTFDAEKRNTPKNIKRALNRYHKLNGSVLRKYRRFYLDPVEFYNQVDDLFNKIDVLIHEAHK